MFDGILSNFDVKFVKCRDQRNDEKTCLKLAYAEETGSATSCVVTDVLSFLVVGLLLWSVFRSYFGKKFNICSCCHTCLMCRNVLCCWIRRLECQIFRIVFHILKYADKCLYDKYYETVGGSPCKCINEKRINEKQTGSRKRESKQKHKKSVSISESNLSNDGRPKSTKSKQGSESSSSSTSGETSESSSSGSGSSSSSSSSSMEGDVISSKKSSGQINPPRKYKKFIY